MRAGLPVARAGQTVGLFGGSFDPPHEGHVRMSLEALRRFGLDRVWWLVSPGNPLKARGPAPIERRVEAARRVMRHPLVAVTALEARTRTRYTAETIEAVRVLYPGVRFVWLMGADSLADFHRWERWEDILATTPVGVLARPGQRISARTSVAARRFRRFRLPAERAQLLARAEPPAWCFVNVPMVEASSTAIRARGGWASAGPGRG